MRTMFSMLVVLALCAGGAFAQMDWGADADSVIVVLPSDGTVDMAGEGELRIGGTFVADSVAESTVVQQVYNMDSIGYNMDMATKAGDTLWFPYVILNMGNGVDSIGINVVGFNNSMSVGDLLIAQDMNMDSIFNIGDTVVDIAGSHVWIMPEDAIQNVLLGVVIDTLAIDTDSMSVSVVVTGNMNTGTDDFWPINYPAYILAPDNGDLQADTFQVTVGLPVVFFTTQANKSTAVPGDTINYTLQYDNDGSDSTNVVSGLGLFITQRLPQYVTYSPSTFNMTGTHTGGNPSVMFSNVNTPLVYDQAIGWADTNPDSVAGFEIQFGADIAANDTTGDGGTDTQGAADGSFPDADAGQVTFQVIVK